MVESTTLRSICRTSLTGKRDRASAKLPSPSPCTPVWVHDADLPLVPAFPHGHSPNRSRERQAGTCIRFVPVRARRPIRPVPVTSHDPRGYGGVRPGSHRPSHDQCASSAAVADARATPRNSMDHLGTSSHASDALLVFRSEPRAQHKRVGVVSVPRCSFAAGVRAPRPLRTPSTHTSDG